MGKFDAGLYKLSGDVQSSIWRDERSACSRGAGEGRHAVAVVRTNLKL